MQFDFIIYENVIELVINIMFFRLSGKCNGEIKYIRKLRNIRFKEQSKIIEERVRKLIKSLKQIIATI